MGRHSREGKEATLPVMTTLNHQIESTVCWKADILCDNQEVGGADGAGGAVVRAPVILTDFPDIARPDRCALLLVDPQHDFCSPEGAVARRFGFDMREILAAVPRLNDLIAAARSHSVLVVWIRGVASDPRMFPNQKARRGTGESIWLLREGSPGAEWFEGMIRPLEDESVVTKDTYDAFEYTDLDLILGSHGISTVVMTGFTTNVCVETTARHAFTKGYYVVAVSDCTGAPTAGEHEAALHNIAAYFGHVVDSHRLLEVWNAGRSDEPQTTSDRRET